MSESKEHKCFRCGTPLEVACLPVRTRDRLCPAIVPGSEITMCCPNRCDVDMRVYREATPDEMELWRKRYPCASPEVRS